jgi:hypothetical protein
MKITPQYIAGFIDGEGYFGIVKKNDTRFGMDYYYVPVLKISQVTQHRAVLDAIKKYLGYGIFWEGKNTSTSNGKRVSSLEFRGMKRVFPIVKKLYPYLIVKKPQAEILLEYSKLPVYTYNKRGEAKMIELDRQRTILYKKIRACNHRGVAETK